MEIDQIFELYLKNGHQDYIGEQVSQIEHALQCAYQAENEKYSNEVILGALFHDIGHLLDNMPLMILNEVNYGVTNHEKIGANYLRSFGINEKICFLVENHVQAKRYLVFKQPEYYEKLSESSKMTLKFQGGPMSNQEAKVFESSDTFEVILKMRTWDDKAKNERMNLTNESKSLFKKYRNMLIKLI